METGEESELEAIDALRPTIDDVSGGAKGGGAKAGGAAAAKAAAAASKGDTKQQGAKGGTGKDAKGAGERAEEERAAEQRRREEMLIEQEEALKAAEERKSRRHPHALWLLRLKTELAQTLLAQNRFREHSTLVDRFKADCKQFNDQYFYRLNLE